jgi:two-component system chemotaxis response regulator CheY
MATKTCLIVDDSRVVRAIAKRIVDALGFASSEAEDGRAALDACRSRMPDAILLDWNMPVMGGIEFLQELRRLPTGDQPKVVFCTTENGIEQIQAAIEAGADEYIMKPFDKDIVLSKFGLVGLL